MFADDVDATGDYITVSGTVSIPDKLSEAGYETCRDNLTVAFVGEDHFTSCKSTDGHYSVDLKIGEQYSVRCFNTGKTAKDQDIPFGETTMSYVYYNEIKVDESLSTLNVVLDKGIPYEDPNGVKYFIYESLKVATLVELPIEYTELDSIEEDGYTYERYEVKSGQSFTIPEYLNGGYKVIFVGTSVGAERGAESIIKAPASDIYSHNSTYKNELFQGTGADLNITFKGSVILNDASMIPYYPSKNYQSQSACDTTIRLNFNVIFEKDVYVNSFFYQNGNASPAGSILEALKDVRVEGVFYGAVYYMAKTNVLAQTPAYRDPLTNTNFSIITFSDNISLDKSFGPKGTSGALNGSTITTLGVLFDSKYDLVSHDPSGYSIKDSGGNVLGVSVENCFDAIVLKTVCLNDVESIVLAKGATKELDVPNPPEGMAFSGWYKDSGFTVPYDSTEILRADVSVYARFIPIGEEQILFTVVDGGTKISEVLDKGDSKPVVGPVSVPQNMRFDDWYIDAEYKTKYVAEALTADTTVYVRYVIDSYTVKFSEGVESISGLHAGDVISLVSVSKDGNEFNGWMVNDLLLGAQYIVSARDADESGNILLTASFSEKADTVKTSWTLTVTLGSGAEGKVFWTTTNALGSYGMITVLPGEFEKVSYSAVSTNGSCAPISDNCALVFSADGNDVSVTVSISEPVKASEYEVSVAEIASGEKHGFKATVTAKDGYVDSAGAFAISYVYKTWNDTDKVWIYTTSGVTENVSNFTVAIPTDKKVSSITGEFLLDNDDAILVFGYATFSFKGTSATGTVEDVIVHSPVIMCVSEIQAVVGKP